MKQFKINAKATVAVAIAVASFFGFNSFKKADPHYYKLVNGEYRMVVQSSGSCQPGNPETCLWKIESDELTIPESADPTREAYSTGEFNGDYATAP